MVNAEADACIGPEIAASIEATGKLYSLADGDQPSLTVGLADWATAIGFSVVTAGKWTDAWDPRGAREIEAEWVSQGRVVSDTDRMFLDGTKANIELGSTANCLEFVPDVPGMHGESTGLDRIPSRFRASGPDAVFSSSGIVDYINCVGLSKDQVYPGGVFVVAESANRTGMEAMARKGNIVSDDLRHVLFYRPYHLLGVETVHSIVRVLLYGIPTASPKGRYTEVVAIAKQDLKAGEVLLGAGYELRGELWTASDSRSAIAVPSGLAAGATVLRDVTAGSPLTLEDVTLDISDPAVVLRGDLSGSTARPGTQHG
jgi:predicted homoserine dehydrogenase-like protein